MASFSSFRTSAGLAYNFYKGNTQTIVVLVHANGFCKEIWNETIRLAFEVSPNLDSYCSILALDLTGHGDSRHLKEFSVERFGHDILDCIQDLEDREVGQSTTRQFIGIGHSIGASSLLQSALLSPKVYSHLKLVEPILAPAFPPELPKEKMPMYPLTIKRRREFASVEDAVVNWSTKKTFKYWNPNVLQDYATYGLKYDNSSSQYTLKCNPETEAQVFLNGAPGLYDGINNIELSSPSSTCELFAGEHTKTTSMLHPKGMIGLLGEVVANAIDACHGPSALQVIPNAGHLVVMEKPEIFAQNMVQTVKKYSKEHKNVQQVYPRL